MRLTNEHNIALPLAIWLLNDEYDYVNDKKYLSATGLMRPTRQIVLGKRAGLQNDSFDISSMIASRLGTAVHDSIEKAWDKSKLDRALTILGYGHMIGKILINPTKEQAEAEPGKALVYLEQRTIKEFQGYRIGGKFDLILDGIVNDYKTTSVYAYILGSRDEEHALQGSLYRWLNPDKITGDYITIHYLFTDWQSAKAKVDPNYPKTRIVSKNIPLLSIEDTEKYVINKLREIEAQMDQDQETMVRCTRQELWMKDPQYKYYSDPAKTSGKSTKNFSSLFEANSYMQSKGKGVVLTVDPKPTRCEYCPVSDNCLQKEQMLND